MSACSDDDVLGSWSAVLGCTLLADIRARLRSCVVAAVLLDLLVPRVVAGSLTVAEFRLFTSCRLLLLASVGVPTGSVVLAMSPSVISMEVSTVLPVCLPLAGCIALEARSPASLMTFSSPFVGWMSRPFTLVGAAGHLSWVAGNGPWQLAHFGVSLHCSPCGPW